MEAINFVRTFRRMCNSYQSVDCQNQYGENCPLKSLDCNFIDAPTESMETIISKVENWGKVHPTRTRSSNLKKVFPNVVCLDDGVPDICPTPFDCGVCHGKQTTNCTECKKKFWNTEIQED